MFTTTASQVALLVLLTYAVVVAIYYSYKMGKLIKEKEDLKRDYEIADMVEQKLPEELDGIFRKIQEMKKKTETISRSKSFKTRDGHTVEMVTSVEYPFVGRIFDEITGEYQYLRFDILGNYVFQSFEDHDLDLIVEIGECEDSQSDK